MGVCKRGRSAGSARGVVEVAAVLCLLGVGAVAAEDIDGTAGDDVLTGTSAADAIDGRAGDDLLHGKGGPDSLVGGRDDDEIYGDAGADVLEPEGYSADVPLAAGSDMLRGGRGPDVINGFGGDTAYGAGEDDEIQFVGYTSGAPARGRGGPGDDKLTAFDAGTVRLFGDAGDDAIEINTAFGGAENSSAFGGPGDDAITLWWKAQTLKGWRRRRPHHLQHRRR